MRLENQARSLALSISQVRNVMGKEGRMEFAEVLRGFAVAGIGTDLDRWGLQLIEGP